MRSPVASIGSRGDMSAKGLECVGRQRWGQRLPSRARAGGARASAPVGARVRRRGQRQRQRQDPCQHLRQDQGQRPDQAPGQGIAFLLYEAWRSTGEADDRAAGRGTVRFPEHGGGGVRGGAVKFWRELSSSAAARSESTPTAGHRTRGIRVWSLADARRRWSLPGARPGGRARHNARTGATARGPRLATPIRRPQDGLGRRQSRAERASRAGSRASRRRGPERAALPVARASSRSSAPF
jgi:hypothetical protein